MSSLAGVKYNISDNIRRFMSNGHMSSESSELPNCYKLVYEMNFDCSKCLMDLHEIHNFYIQQSADREIELCLISTQRSYGYIKYRLDQSLGYYELWVIEQKTGDNHINLYLIDNLDNIVVAGDILKYPFLKNIFIRKFKNIL